MWILLGVIDTYLALWSSWYSIPYTPTFSIFSVAAGVLLYRGGLKTANFLRICALFGLAYCVLDPLLNFFIFPLDYQLLTIRLDPWDRLVSVLTGILEIIFAFWLQQVLGRNEVTNAQVDARITPTSVRTPLWCGAVLTVFGVGMLAWGLHGGYANKAIAYAKAKMDANDKYFANSIYIEFSDPIDVTVNVVAYNSTGFDSMTVHWKDAGP